jgi:hypothetical protein
VRRQGLEPRTRGLRGQSSPLRSTTTCDSTGLQSPRLELIRRCGTPIAGHGHGRQVHCGRKTRRQARRRGPGADRAPWRLLRNVPAPADRRFASRMAGLGRGSSALPVALAGPGLVAASRPTSALPAAASWYEHLAEVTVVPAGADQLGEGSNGSRSSRRPVTGSGCLAKRPTRSGRCG